MQALLLFLPLLGSALLHAPVLRFDLLRILKRPIDGGQSLGGVRIFGDNKTWRGAIVMDLVALARQRLLVPASHSGTERRSLAGRGSPRVRPGHRRTTDQLPQAPARNRPWSPQAQSRQSVLLAIFDQGDFVPVVWATLARIWVMPPVEVAVAFVAVVLLHMLINIIGFSIGARKTWI